jgi:hypothetical protein
MVATKLQKKRFKKRAKLAEFCRESQTLNAQKKGEKKSGILQKCEM